MKFEGPLGERFERGSACGVNESLKLTPFPLNTLLSAVQTCFYFVLEKLKHIYRSQMCYLGKVLMNSN